MSRLPSEFEADAVESGRQVRQLREARGWSQYDLADRVDPPISRQQLHLIEHGRSGGLADGDALLANPRLATLISLCRALDARVVIDINRPTGLMIVIESHGRRRRPGLEAVAAAT